MGRKTAHFIDKEEFLVLHLLSDHRSVTVTCKHVVFVHLSAFGTVKQRTGTEHAELTSNGTQLCPVAVALQQSFPL